METWKYAKLKLTFPLAKTNSWVRNDDEMHHSISNFEYDDDAFTLIRAFYWFVLITRVKQFPRNLWRIQNTSVLFLFLDHLFTKDAPFDFSFVRTREITIFDIFLKFLSRHFQKKNKDIHIFFAFFESNLIQCATFTCVFINWKLMA